MTRCFMTLLVFLGCGGLSLGQPGQSFPRPNIPRPPSIPPGPSIPPSPPAFPTPPPQPEPEPRMPPTFPNPPVTPNQPTDEDPFQKPMGPPKSAPRPNTPQSPPPGAGGTSTTYFECSKCKAQFAKNVNDKCPSCGVTFQHIIDENGRKRQTEAGIRGNTVGLIMFGLFAVGGLVWWIIAKSNAPKPKRMKKRRRVVRDDDDDDY